MPEIGATLREARMRARIDVSEIEATTKIRAKYLRALENEEWSLLPGPTFVKSFLRTYAEALGLDGKALVEEYRLSQEHQGDGPGEPIIPSSERRRSRGPSGGPSRGYTVAVVSILAVIVLLVVLLATNSGGKSNPSGSTHTTTGRGTATGTTGHAGHANRHPHRRPLAAGPLGRLRVPDRRRRPQADPRARAAARADDRDLPCKAL